MTSCAPTRGRSAGVFLALLAALAGVAIASVYLGAVQVGPPWGSALSATERTILWELRVPRVVLAMLLGAGLSTAGAAYQSLFQNPLADPFVIGASSGAALGATAAVLLGLSGGLFGMAPVTLFAFAGTVLAVLAVFFLGGLGPRASPITLLLAGAALSTVLGALVSLGILLDDQSLQVMFTWLLGGLGGRGWQEVLIAAGLVGPGAAVLLLLHRPLDALTLGDRAAQSFGLPVREARAAVIGAASLVTAAAVALAGIIGFVGLLGPHMVRLVVGSAHGRLLPASALSGAILLVVADAAARTAAAPLEIPVGIMTALMGGPFFLWLLRRRGLGGGGA